VRLERTVAGANPRRSRRPSQACSSRKASLCSFRACRARGPWPPDPDARTAPATPRTRRSGTPATRPRTGEGLPTFRIGIGVNTGTVIAGTLGGPGRLDYTVLGDAVNVAQRLQSEAVGGEILAAAVTVRLVGTDLAEPVGLKQLKARQHLVRSTASAGRAPPPAQQPGRGPPTPNDPMAGRSPVTARKPRPRLGGGGSASRLGATRVSRADSTPPVYSAWT
jgi:hypothetical protein